jgi:hypothetical protein
MFSVDMRSVNRLIFDLKQVHKAALPNSVRFTLNDMAFDVKKLTLVQGLHETSMKIKSDSFFKRYSGVEKATGWDVNKMQSQVGMMPSLGVGKADKTINRLEQQDEGGSLRHDAIGLDNARIGKISTGRIKQVSRRKNLKFWGKPIEYGDNQGLIRTVTASKIESGGKGKGNVIQYGKIIFEINGFFHHGASNSKGNVSHKGIVLDLTKLYSEKSNRIIHVKPQHFMQNASNLTGKKIEEIFRINAERQLNKWK